MSKDVPTLFKPIIIRSQCFQNRIWVSPMCQYSCACRQTETDLPGRLTTHHQTHYASFIARGPSLTIIEATAVNPKGRISPYDSGLWCDEQLPPIEHLVKFAHAQHQKVGIQLAHAGRKGSTVPPFIAAQFRKGSVRATEAENGWPGDVVSASVSSSWHSTALSIMELVLIVGREVKISRGTAREVTIQQVDSILLARSLSTR